MWGEPVTLFEPSRDRRPSVCLNQGMRRLVLVASSLAALGCTTPSALPIRGVMAGAPGHLAPGELEVSAAGIGLFNGGTAVPTAPLIPGGWAAATLGEHLSVEFGGVFIPIGAGAGFGFAGARWSGTLLDTPHGSFVGDADLGFGLGGTLCTSSNCPGSRSPRVFEAGLSQGGSVGFRMAPVTLFLRARAEEVSTLRGPAMVYPFVALGVELRPAPALALGLDMGGFGMYGDGYGGGFAPFYQLQATLFVDAPWLRPTATSATAR